ncbi:ABC transporter ATP-binding protein [Saccharibacillus sp. O16]|nr:ABC transporter ATP-binding protein [Saccharibacillus sp. O16]
MSAELQMEQVKVRYGGFTALNHVTLHVPARTTLGLVGESGSGKSTLARAVAGLLVPDEGRMSLGGRPLEKRRSREQRKQIQMIFQNPDASLNPRHSVRRILSEALRFHNMTRGRVQTEQRCLELLERVRLSADSLDKYPHEFSGGQRQRIAIARALSVEPELLIADEPTSALDVSVQRSVLELFREIREELNLTVLFISHDLGVIHAVSDTVAVMRQGELLELAPKEAFFAQPQTNYGRELLAAVPKMPTASGLVR